MPARWSALDDDALVGRLLTAPLTLERAFADEVVARGRRLVAPLSKLIFHECNWRRQDAGRDAVAHAVRLLGALGVEQALPALLYALREADSRDDYEVSDALPALFGRIGAPALSVLRVLAGDPAAPCGARYDAMRAMAAVTLRAPGRAEEVFAFIASVAADEEEDDDTRGLAADILLDFARGEHAPLLRELARSGAAEGWYEEDDIDPALAHAETGNYEGDPLDYYALKAVAERLAEAEAERLDLNAALAEAQAATWGEDPDACGGQEEDGPGPVSGLRRPLIAMERMSRHTARAMEGREFADAAAMNAYLRQFAGKIPAPAPRHALDEAQELAYDAWQERSPSRRLDLARRVLALSADCADGWSLQAEELPDPRLAAELFERAVAAGLRALGPDAVKEHAGHFWGVVETRPFMRALSGRAECRYAAGDTEGALADYAELLRLNPRDNQGCRTRMASCLAATGRFDALAELLDRAEYADSPDADWLLLKALTAFVREGPGPSAERALRAAVEANAHLPDYFLSGKPIPADLPESVAVGGPEEAAWAAAEFLPIWQRVLGALSWFASVAGRQAPSRVGRNDPCPCGSAKKYKKCCLTRTQ